MKKLIHNKPAFFLLMILLGVCSHFVMAGITGYNLNARPTSDWFSGNNTYRDVPHMWMKAADQLMGMGIMLGDNDVWYVDSNQGTAVTEDGTSWVSAYDTLDEAVSAAGEDDVILIAEEHTETLGASGADGDEVDCDVAGLRIIGLGQGNRRPIFDYTGTNTNLGAFAIGEDCISIDNCIWNANVPDVNEAILVEDGVAYFTLTNCAFTATTAGTDEFFECVTFVNDNTGCTIDSCYANMKGGGAANAVIFADADTDQLSIVNCDFRGDYAVAVIGGDTTASTDLLIRNNLLINGALVGDGGANAIAAISLLDASAGMVMDNTIVSDVATFLLMRVADDCTFSNNWCIDKDGDEFSAALETLEAASVDAAIDGG